MANLLKHERFERRPVALAKRPRRLPRGVVSINSVRRLKAGVLAEIVCSTIEANNGKRVRITEFDPSEGVFCCLCRSLDGDVRYTDGGFGKDVWLKAKNLRRLWTGNTTPAKAGVL